jgi:hypothetical protein
MLPITSKVTISFILFEHDWTCKASAIMKFF